MPPRYAYWTILIDGKATAFRARDREELLPTFNQLARKNTNIVMRYFARGRLWDTPEQAQWDSRNRAERRGEPRGKDWRPGGQHKDPRAQWSGKSGRAGGAGQAGRSDGPRGAGRAGGPTFKPSFDRPQEGRERRFERPKGPWRSGSEGRFKGASHKSGAGQAGRGERPDGPKRFGGPGRRPPRKPR